MKGLLWVKFFQQTETEIDCRLLRRDKKVPVILSDPPTK